MFGVVVLIGTFAPLHVCFATVGRLITAVTGGTMVDACDGSDVL